MRAKFPFEFVVMLGDNIYGGQTAADFKLKFENPYKPMLDGGVFLHAQPFHDVKAILSARHSICTVNLEVAG